MKFRIVYIIIFFWSVAIRCLVASDNEKVIVGADELLAEHYDLIRGRKVAIVTNHTAVLSSGIHLVDTLFARNDVTITALFGPEHGIRGDAPDGLTIKDGIDTKTGLPVYSLYGKTRKPTREMLKNSDVILFDIQDIGARFYTFISTMYYTIEAAADFDIPVIILDRPNPIGGINVDGPIRSEDLKSFVAIAPIPIIHGMTVGELALMFNGESMIESEKKASITVVKLKHWQRNFYYDDCGLKWINPSPNMNSLNTAIVYPGMCLVEGINVSEGRGTFMPFLQIGAPYIDSESLIMELSNFKIEGIKINPVRFSPKSIENMSLNPKYKNKTCFGIELNLTDREKFESLKFGVILIYAIHKLYPGKFEFRKNWLDKLFGRKYLREMISNNRHPSEIIEKWNDDVVKFRKLREKYLLY
jgi:uncharacterized protein YbbC (DUF1343 family)